MITSYNPSFPILLVFHSQRIITELWNNLYWIQHWRKKKTSTREMLFLHVITYYIGAPIVLGHKTPDSEQYFLSFWQVIKLTGFVQLPSWVWNILPWSQSVVDIICISACFSNSFVCKSSRPFLLLSVVVPAEIDLFAVSFYAKIIIFSQKIRIVDFQGRDIALHFFALWLKECFATHICIN